MSKFKVGDIVVGLPGNGYNFTGEGSICKVINYKTDWIMSVEVIKPANPSPSRNRHIGEKYPVTCEGFKLQRPKLLENE